MPDSKRKNHIKWLFPVPIIRLVNQLAIDIPLDALLVPLTSVDMKVVTWVPWSIPVPPFNVMLGWLFSFAIEEIGVLKHMQICINASGIAGCFGKFNKVDLSPCVVINAIDPESGTDSREARSRLNACFKVAEFDRIRFELYDPGCVEQIFSVSFVFMILHLQMQLLIGDPCILWLPLPGSPVTDIVIPLRQVQLHIVKLVGVI